MLPATATDTNSLPYSGNASLTLTISPTFYLASNGVTIKCSGCSAGDTGMVSGTTYTAHDNTSLANKSRTDTDWDRVVTTLVTDMSGLFDGLVSQNQAFNQNLSSWDTSNVTDMSGMFKANNSLSSANQNFNSWDTSKVTDMSYMFESTDYMNPQIDSWDVSSVTNMESMFQDCRLIGYNNSNQAIGSWDVSSVTSMRLMFNRTDYFNIDIGSWDTSSVTDMTSMFYNALVFNQNIGGWNTSNVTNTQAMFNGARQFNQDLNSWDVSKVTTMNSMFKSAPIFNGNISSWNTSSVTDMRQMFDSASRFNQDIGNWNVSSVSNGYSMGSMFQSAGDFVQDISGWCVSQISTEPNNFKNSAGTNSWNSDTSKHPQWGVCNSNVSVILSDTDADNILVASDTVTITAAFTEAMNTAPTISITGVVTNVTMTALTGAEKAVQIGETLYGSGVNDQFGAVGGGSGYGDTHLSKNGKVFAFASGYKNTGDFYRLIVYELVNGAWTNITGNLPQTLVSGAEQNTMALSRDGHTIVIGAYNNTTLRNGRIYAYRYNGSSWTRLGDDNDMLGYSATYQLGYHVDISDDGNRIFANGQGQSGYEADGGYINVYDWDGTDWNMHKNSSGNTKWSFRDALSAASDGRDMGNIGMSVSSNGNRVIVETATSDVISTWDYTPSGSASWTMTPGYLTPPYTGYWRGSDISDDGKTLVIGVHQQSSGSGQSNVNQGNVFVYSWNSGTSTWTLKGSNIPIVGSSLTNGEYLGYNVSISSDGNRISFGNFESAADRRGKVAIYDYNASSNQWVEYATLISDKSTTTARSSELSGDGNRILIGDNSLDVDGNNNAGSIEVYQLGGYKYVWDVDSGGAPPDGTYYATVAGTASATGGTYSGTESITFILDTTAPTVTLTDTDSDNLVSTSEVVTITAVFSEAMTTTPTISITGIVTNVIMTQTSGNTSYTFTWDTSSGTLTTGNYVATVSGTDLIGNPYVAGTQSITFRVDTSTPTVSITTNDPDNTIKPGDNITVTVTFNEPMASGPRITIGSAVSNVALTATNSTTFTYSWSTSGVSAGSYTVTVTGTDLAGNTYAGSDKITIRLDSTAPTVTLTDSDSDNLLAASDTVTITATFSEAMTATPTISITGTVTDVAMTLYSNEHSTFNLLDKTNKTTGGSGGNSSISYVYVEPRIATNFDGSYYARRTYGKTYIYKNNSLELESQKDTEVGANVSDDVSSDYSMMKFSSNGQTLAYTSARKILMLAPKTCITTTEIVMAIGPRILYRPQIT
jgi:surface protein